MDTRLAHVDPSPQPRAADAPGTSRGAWRAILTDVAVVTVTPFAGPDLERVDVAGLERNLEHLMDRSVRLLVAGGNTGEFASLSDRERLAIVTVHRSVAGDRARLIAGVGYRSDEAVGQALAAMRAGADGVMVHHPIHPYTSEDGLIAYYCGLAKALPDVPFLPYLRGPQLEAAGARALQELPTVVGVKMGQADPERFARLVAAAPDLAWVCGVAEGWAVPFAQAGAVGFTSGLANVLPERSLAIHAVLSAGDAAAASRLVDSVRPIEALRAERGDANNVAVIKAALDLVGLTGGDLRPPLAALRAADRARLVEILQQLEVLP